MDISCPLFCLHASTRWRQVAATFVLQNISSSLKFESTFEFGENKNPFRHRVSLKRWTTCKRETSGPGFHQHGAIEIRTLLETAAALVITQPGKVGLFSQVLSGSKDTLVQLLKTTRDNDMVQSITLSHI